MSDNNFPPELLKSLNAVMFLMQNVLSDIREHSTSLAIVKTKLENITENVDELARVVINGNGKGSMMTRVALAEKELENIEEQINEIKDDVHNSIKELKSSIESSPKKTEEEDSKQKRDKSIAKWQAIGAIFAAFVAVALQLFQLIK